MRARLTLLLLAPALAVVGLQLGTGPAAATNTTLRAGATPAPLAGELVHLSGAVSPARRVVYLQRYVGGHWRSISATRTGAQGTYSFSVRAYGTSYAYRTYARALRFSGHLYGTRLSNYVRITPAKPSVTLSSVSNVANAQPQTNAAVASGASRFANATGSFYPARPGRSVTVQALENGAWVAVASGRQDDDGSFVAPVPLEHLGTATAPATLRAYAQPVPGFAAVDSESITPTYQTEVFHDDFDGSSLDSSLWRARLQPEQTLDVAAEKRRRLCSSIIDGSLITVGNGVADLGVARRFDAKTGCDSGRFYNSMIGTADTGKVFKYGTFAARVKFNQGQGGHGAFWMQGPAVTGAELDVAEYFGDGRHDGGLTAFVHWTDALGQNNREGQATDYSSILGAGNTPSGGYHIYSITWTPSGYVYYVDGAEVMRTALPHVSTEPEEMILSMLTSDYEIPRMGASAPSMQVDWVRVWQ